MLERFAKEENGAILVEFGLVLPFLLLVFFGIIGWGYTLSLTNHKFDAARQAAREMAVNSSKETQAANNARAALGVWPETFIVVAEDNTTTGTDDVVVTITAPNALAGIYTLIPMVPTLSAEVVMRKEQQP